jgi:hypothetical protein
MKLLYTIISIFCFLSIDAQTSVQGKVVDDRTGEAIPFFNVYFEGKKNGTATDVYGKFKISSPNAEKKINFSSMGYTTKSETIKPNETNSIYVRVVSNTVNIKDKTIKGKPKKLPKDTIAIRIFRNVVKNKENNRASSFASFEYNEYSKLEMDLANLDSIAQKSLLLKPFKVLLQRKDTTEAGEIYFPIYFKETFTKNYSTADPSRKKKLIVADKITELLPFESISDLLGYSFEEIDIYNNQIIIANRSFMSPIADNGLILYKYYVEDSFKVGDKMNYRLIYAPRSKEDFGFTGKMLVEEGSWAIKEMMIGVDKRANINFVKRFDISQYYKSVDGKWVMYKDARDVAMSINKKSKKTFNVRFKQSNVKDSIFINKPLPENAFKGEATEKMEGFNHREDNFWMDKRIDSLSQKELDIYAATDSAKTKVEYKRLMFGVRIATTGHIPIHSIGWEIGKFYQFMSWNSIEGIRLRLGARTTPEFSKKFMLFPYIAYGTKDKEFKYGFEFLTNLKTKHGKWHQFGVSGMHDYFKFGQTEDVLAYDNIVNSVFRSPNEPMTDLLKKSEVKVTYLKEHNSGLHTNFWLIQQQIYASDRFKYLKFNENGTYNSLPSIVETKLMTEFRWAPKQPVFDQPFYRRRLKGVKPIVSIFATGGVKGLFKSDYTFLTLKFHMKHTMPSPIGITNYQIIAGKVFGDVPYTELEMHPGNTTFLRDDFRYLLLRDFEYASDMHAALWVDHLFNGTILNKIPLIKKLKLREGITGKVLWGDISQSNRAYMALPNGLYAPNKIYAELGFNVYNILKFLRLDFTWRLTEPQIPNPQRFKVMASALFTI